MARPPPQANAQYGSARVGIAGLDLDGVPQRQDLVGEVEADPVDAGHGPEAGVTEDERAGRVAIRPTLPVLWEPD